MNSDKQSINRINDFVTMHRGRKKPTIPLTKDEGEAIGRTAGLGLAILKEIHRIKTALGKQNIDLYHPPADMSAKRREAITNALGRLFIAKGKLSVFTKTLREADEHNKKATKRKGRRQIHKEVCEAVIAAGDASAHQMGFEMYKMGARGNSTSISEELAHEFLTGWVASEKVVYVENAVSRGKPENVVDATLLELRTGVYMQEPGKTAPEAFAAIPAKVRGKKEGVAGTNETTADRIRGTKLRLVSEQKELDVIQGSTGKTWLENIIHQENAQSFLSRAKFSQREREYISTVLRDAELYLDPDGGNIAVAKVMGIPANNVAQIKYQVVKKMRLASEQQVA